jgi:hypothetical protein
MSTVFEQQKEKGDWFPFFGSKIDLETGEILYDPPEEGAAEFCFRSPAPFWQERQRGRGKEHKMVLNPSTRQMERVGYFPDLPPDEEQAERDDSWDYCITGMKGARWTADGPEMECTKENKLKLLKNSAFLRYANRVLQLILETGAKHKNAAEKN